MVRRFVVALVIASLAAPASADWQYAQWGQSPEAVIAASNGAAQAVAGNERQRVFDFDFLARSRFEWGGIPLEVRFHFDRSRRLAAIKLMPFDKGNCDQLKAVAEAEFGPGEASSPLAKYATVKSVRIDWRDPAARNRMFFADLVAGELRFCHVIYRPL